MSASKHVSQEIVREAIHTVDSGETVGDPGDVRRLLHAVSDLAPDLQVTQHPLGFMHVDLSEVVDTGSARLHLWSEEFVARADPLGRVHDHTWELRSCVLVGQLRDHVFSAALDSDGPYIAHLIHYASSGNRSETADGRWRLDEVDVRTVQQGQHYQLAPRLVHQTEVMTLPTVTLVVPIEHGGPGPVVYAPLCLVGGEAAKRAPVKTAHAVAALRAAARVAIS